MVRITNGIDIFEVTSGAFESVFSKQGYMKVVDTETAEEVKTEEVETAVNVDEFEELLEKPISQWNKTEVKKFAHVKGIDISGTKSIIEAKDIIKKHLN